MKEVNEAEFEQIIAENRYVLIDFWSTWCGPCKMIAPVLDEIEKEYGDTIAFVKADIDKNDALAQKYGIFTIPNVCLFKDGKLADRVVGFKPKKDLLKFINKQIDK